MQRNQNSTKNTKQKAKIKNQKEILSKHIETIEKNKTNKKKRKEKKK